LANRRSSPAKVRTHAADRGDCNGENAQDVNRIDKVVSQAVHIAASTMTRVCSRSGRSQQPSDDKKDVLEHVDSPMFSV